VSAPGQWTSLASNRDASQVYFVTRLVQQGSSQPLYGKLFLADWSGIHALLIRNRDVTPFAGLNTNSFTTNSYNILSVDVASDVSRLAVVATFECQLTSTLCSGSDTATTVYDSNGQGIDLAGRGRLSPDGKWLSLITTSRLVFGIGPTPASVQNLVTGISSAFFFPNRNRDHQNGSVADNGSFVFGSGIEGLSFAANDTPVIKLAAAADTARIDASGRTVIWAQPLNGSAAIMAADTQTKAVRTLFSSLNSAYAPSISLDGAAVLFITEKVPGNPQAFRIATNGTGLAQVTDEPTGVSDAKLSPDGLSILAIAGDGSLLRMQIGSGKRDVIIGPTLSFRDQTLVGTPGEVIRVVGTNLRSSKIALDGRVVPVIATAPTAIDFQVPWDLLPGTTQMLTITPATAESGWERAEAPVVRIVAVKPAIFSASHQDFQSFLSPIAPAHPGEIIHLYATGLGEVTNTPPNGMPKPDAPLSSVISSLSASLSQSGSSTAVEVLFAGLAPRLIGYYQIDLRLPVSLETGDAFLQIRVGGGIASITIPVANP